MDAAELIAEGIALAGQGDAEGARERFERATQADPTSTEAWMRLGSILDALNRPEEELGALARALALDPTHVTARVQRVWALFKLRRYTEGLSECDQALKLAPDDAELWDVRAMTFMGLQRYEEALSASDEAVARAPRKMRFWANRMTLFQVWNQPEKGLEACERALALDPTNRDLLIAKGYLLGNLRRYQDSETAFNQGITPEATDERAYFQRGVARYYLSKPEQALDDFQRATELGLADTSVHVFTAQTLERLDRTEEALRYYDLAVTQTESPLHWFAWMKRGMALANLARYDEAAASTGRATELAPDIGDVWFHHATVLEGAGRFADAVAAFDKALELDPNHKGAQARRASVPSQLTDRMSQVDGSLASHHDDFHGWWSRGDLFCEAGRFDLAVPNLVRALSLAPEEETLWNQLGWCLNMCHDYRAAITALRRGSELGGNNPNIWGNMSHAYVQLEDYENARETGERALQIDPNHLQSLANLGSALLNLKRPAEAMVYFDRALAIQPSATRWSNKAVALWRLDRAAEALDCVDQALALDSHDPSLLRLKAMITASGEGANRPK